MKKVVLAVVLSTSLGAFATYADDITGYVSDAHCGAAHHAVSDANTKCINKCLGGGSDPVLVSNGKVIKFDDASKDKAKAFAGENVKIDGTMAGDVVTVNSIDKAQ